VLQEDQSEYPRLLTPKVKMARNMHTCHLQFQTTDTWKTKGLRLKTESS